MAQIIVINDTGSAISATTAIDLDGVNKVPPVRYINSGALVSLGTGSTTTVTVPGQTTLASTASAPSSGNYVYRESATEVKLGVDMEVYHMLVLDVELENEYVRT